MRMILLGAAVLLVAGSGCVAVSSKDNQIGSGRTAFVYHDRVYIYDGGSRVTELDMSRVDAKRVRVESTHTE